MSRVLFWGICGLVFASTGIPVLAGAPASPPAPPEQEWVARFSALHYEMLHTEASEPHVPASGLRVEANPVIKTLARPWRFFTDPPTIGPFTDAWLSQYRPLRTLTYALE